MTATLSSQPSALSYKAEIAKAMAALSADPAHIFVGYGLTHGRAMSTIPPGANIIETPVAENLMAGVACGLSLTGRLPILYFERMDFILNALDALVNHLASAATLSAGEFTPAAIIRCTVGNAGKPLFTGPVHTQDFTAALREMGLTVIRLMPGDEDKIVSIYTKAQAQQRAGRSTVIVEYKDLF